jgi:hypothetical protein
MLYFISLLLSNKKIAKYKKKSNRLLEYQIFHVTPLAFLTSWYFSLYLSL